MPYCDIIIVCDDNTAKLGAMVRHEHSVYHTNAIMQHERYPVRSFRTTTGLQITRAGKCMSWQYLNRQHASLNLGAQNLDFKPAVRSPFLSDLAQVKCSGKLSPLAFQRCKASHSHEKDSNSTSKYHLYLQKKIKQVTEIYQEHHQTY